MMSRTPRLPLLCPVVLSTTLATCAPAETATPATTADRSGGSAASPACAGQITTGAVLGLRETTSNQLSGRDVGVSNIFERKLADGHGVVALRMSAILVIHDPDSDEITRPTVVAGSVVTIGADRYCVVEVNAGHDGPGALSLVRLGS